MSEHVRMPHDVEIPKTSFWNKVPVVGALIGIALMVYWGMCYQANPERAVFSYLFAYLSALSIALGCMIFVILQHITRAGWSVLVRRVPEIAMVTMPLFVVLFLPIAFNTHYLFPWTHVGHLDEILEAKAPYLNISFFFVRAAAYFVVWLVIAFWFYKTSVSQDAGRHQEKTRKMWAMSAPAVIGFGLTATFASFDWLMSLQPHWYSTIFGVYFFSGCMLAALAFMILVYMLLQKAGVLTTVITKEHYHDLGKLMFAFTVFWAYIAFSQFMLIWYANIPEESEFYMHRLGHGWQTMSWLMPITNFFIPFFFLLSRHVKRQNLMLALGSIWVLLVHFLDLYWLVMPNYGAHTGDVKPHMHFTMGDAGILIGILALMLAYFSYLLVRRKVAPMGDPRLQESLGFENY